MEDYEKSGKIFIAYKGHEYDEDDITSKLRQFCPSCFTVKTITRSEHGVVFAKIVRDNYTQDSIIHRLKY